jgi:hypothetical protein
MSDVLVLTAAFLLMVGVLVHSVLGEKRLIGPLVARRDGVLASALSRAILRFAWHLTSVAGLVLGVTLVRLVRDPATARLWAVATTGVAFTGAGLVDAWASRGKHVGWPILTAVGVAALLSLQVR